jgi:hypothetical protein
MRVATGALFRVSESNDNASDVKAKVAYTPPAAPLGVSNARLINNPFTSTPVPIEVGGGRLFAPVTTLSAGMENPVIYLDNVKPGQQLQVLTSDGRHLIGSEMTIDEKYQVLTKENGFSDPVTFSDAYLNKSGVNGYLQTNVFYGAKGSVVYAQQFDRLGQPTTIKLIQQYRAQKCYEVQLMDGLTVAGDEHLKLPLENKKYRDRANQHLGKYKFRRPLKPTPVSELAEVLRTQRSKVWKSMAFE